MNGVAIENDQVLGDAVYSEHPGDAMKLNRNAALYAVSRSEFYHLYRWSTGNPRGEVPLASIITVAEGIDDLDQAEMQRKKNSTMLATFFEQPARS